MKLFHISFFSLLACTAAVADSTVAFSSSPTGRSFTDDSGLTLLPNGSLVLVGTFSNPYAITEALPFDTVANAAGWLQFGTTAINSIGPYGGKLIGHIDNTVNAAEFNDLQIFIWVFNGPTIYESTQYGIFSANNASPQWIFARSGLVSIATISLNDPNVYAVQGSVGAELFLLGAIVPEPASLAVVLALGALGITALCRRKSGPGRVDKI